MWTEHPHTRLFLDTFTHVHTSHCGSWCRSTCLHKTCSSTCHHMSERLLFPCFVFFLCLSCLYVLSHFYLFSISKLQLPTMSSPPSMKPKAHRPNEEYCPVAIYNPLTGYEPNQLDGFDCSEASAAIFQDKSVDIDTELSYSCDAELDDELIGKALSSPLFIQEREEPANVRQTYHSHEESLLPAQSFFHTHKYGGNPYTNSVRAKNENQVAKWKTKESGFSLKDKKSKFLLKSDLRSRSTNFKPSLIKEASRN